MVLRSKGVRSKCDSHSNRINRNCQLLEDSVLRSASRFVSGSSQRGSLGRNLVIIFGPRILHNV